MAPFRAANPDHTAQVRIFTPAAELPFAGHPNVGTAFVLARGEAVFGKAVDFRCLCHALCHPPRV
jgi:trans-2,3-dihydro-3-hydroxyanthranilate isomerase